MFLTSNLPHLRIFKKIPDFLLKLYCYKKDIEHTTVAFSIYGVSKASITKWCSQFSEECQSQDKANPEYKNEMEFMKENLRLRKELEESKKESG